MFNFTPASKDIFGSLLEGYGAYSAGKAAGKAANFEAAQLDINAGTAKAAAQRDAIEDTRQSELVQSRILAVAAAQGGASDPTIVRLISQAAGEGAYRAAMSIYGGNDKARQLEMAASARRFEGKNARRVGAIGALTKAASTLYKNYGQGGVADTKIESTGTESTDFSNWWGTGSFE